MSQTLRYTRDQLIALRGGVRTLTSDVIAKAPPLRRKRGCRAGRLVKSKQTRRASCVLSDRGVGRIPVIVGNRPAGPTPRRSRSPCVRTTPVRCRSTVLSSDGGGAVTDDAYGSPPTRGTTSNGVRVSANTSPTPDYVTAPSTAATADIGSAEVRVDPPHVPSRPSTVRHVRLQRHSLPGAHSLLFGSMNVQSANNKIDDIIAMKRDQLLDVMCLCETWHDPDSVSIRRLRAEGLQVLECARPRTKAKQASLAPAYGGVALVTSPGVRLTAVNTGGKKSTLEHICARVTSHGSSCVVLLIYRPGGCAVEASFFSELADLLDRLISSVEPVLIVGDFNIRLDRPNEAASRRLHELFASYGLSCCVSSPTHDRGGLVDVVVTRADSPASVEIIDPGFSDHRLLRWSCGLHKPAPVYESTTYRPWRRLDVDRFRDELHQSALCRDVTSTDVNELAELYEVELLAIFDRILPMRTSTRRRRPSDPWFDDDCRIAKRSCRKLERRALRSASNAIAWKHQRRDYRKLVTQKREAFWRNLIAQQSPTPRRMWQSIDNLLGRGRLPADADISATEFHCFFR